MVTSRSPLFVLVALLCGALIVRPKGDRAARPLTLIDAKPLNALASLVDMKSWHLLTDVPRLAPSQRQREGRERIERIGIISALPADWTEYLDTCDWIEKNYFQERIGSRIAVILDEADRVADLGPFVGARRKLIDEMNRSGNRFATTGPASRRALVRSLTRKWRGWAAKRRSTTLPSFEFCEHEGGQTGWQLTVTLGVEGSISPSVELTRDGDPVGRMARCVETTMSRWFAGTVRAAPLRYTIRVW